MTPKRLLSDRCFLEAPRWRDGHLYVSDLQANEVLRVDLEGTVEVIAALDTPVGLGPLPDGRMLIVAQYERKIMCRMPDGTLLEHADCTAFEDFALNDMTVDAAGRAFVGRWGYDVIDKTVAPANVGLLRVDADGTVTPMHGAVALANGMAITADDRVLIVAESAGCRLTAFDISSDGTLSNQRVWAELDIGFPDGICLDTDGGVWVADMATDAFVRVVEGGDVTDVVHVEGSRAVACALGGDDGRTLFMLASPGPMDRAGSRERRPSHIDLVRVDVPGCERP